MVAFLLSASLGRRSVCLGPGLVAVWSFPALGAGWRSRVPWSLPSRLAAAPVFLVPAPGLVFVRKGDVPRTVPVVPLPVRAPFKYSLVCWLYWSVDIEGVFLRWYISWLFSLLTASSVSGKASPRAFNPLAGTGGRTSTCRAGSPWRFTFPSMSLSPPLFCFRCDVPRPTLQVCFLLALFLKLQSHWMCGSLRLSCFAFTAVEVLAPGTSTCKDGLRKDQGVSCPMRSWRFLRFLCCHVQAVESHSCRGAEAQCSDFKWRSAITSCDFLGYHGWPKYQCSESNTVSGTAGTPDLFAVTSEDFLQAVSQCRPVECGEISGSTYVMTDYLGNQVLTCEEEVTFSCQTVYHVGLKRSMKNFYFVEVSNRCEYTGHS